MALHIAVVRASVDISCGVVVLHRNITAFDYQARADAFILTPRTFVNMSNITHANCPAFYPPYCVTLVGWSWKFNRSLVPQRLTVQDSIVVASPDVSCLLVGRQSPLPCEMPCHVQATCTCRLATVVSMCPGCACLSACLPTCLPENVACPLCNSCSACILVCMCVCVCAGVFVL